MPASQQLLQLFGGFHITSVKCHTRSYTNLAATRSRRMTDEAKERKRGLVFEEGFAGAEKALGE